MYSVKEKDTVIVITGKDKGKTGTVLQVAPRKNKVLVEGVAVATHHEKARKQGQESAIVKKPSFIDLSNVMPVCTSCKKPCRINAKSVDSKKVRVCNKCKEVF
jgi:large subunit ribosomal protein L24